MSKDILHESWTYQQILKEGREEGRKEGRESSIVEGERRALERIALRRFPELAMFLKEHIASLVSEAQLQRASQLVVDAQTAEELKQGLTNLIRH
jgi:predicted transposase YdaD